MSRCDPEREAEYQRAYRKANRARRSEASRAWRAANADRAFHHHLLSNLASRLGCPASEVPPELIELAREALLLKRALAELNKTLKEIA